MFKRKEKELLRRAYEFLSLGLLVNGYDGRRKGSHIAVPAEKAQWWCDEVSQALFSPRLTDLLIGGFKALSKKPRRVK